jgi:hypothetical protein
LRLVADKSLFRRVHGDGASGAAAAEFEGVMKLLARWDRRDAVGPGPGGHRPSPARVRSFDEAIVAVEKRMTVLGFIKPGTGRAKAVRRRPRRHGT